MASIRPFDPISQEPSAVQAAAVATPAEEPQEGARVLDWLTEGALWLLGEGVEVEVPAGVPSLALGRGAAADPEEKDFGARAVGPFGGDPKNAWAEMKRDAARAQKVVLFSLNHGEDARLQEILAEELPDVPVQFLIGPLREASAPAVRVDGVRDLADFRARLARRQPLETLRGQGRAERALARTAPGRLRRSSGIRRGALLGYGAHFGPRPWSAGLREARVPRLGPALCAAD